MSGAKDDFTVELRPSKGSQPGERVRLTFLAESFNLCNRVNQRVAISDDGFLNSGKSICGLLSPSGESPVPAGIREEFPLPDSCEFVCPAADTALGKGKLS